jgi:hypothetical protein
VCDPRARRIYRQQAAGMKVNMIPVPDPDFTPDGWWRNRTGRKIFFYEGINTILSLLQMLVRRDSRHVPNTHQ